MIVKNKKDFHRNILTTISYFLRLLILSTRSTHFSIFSIHSFLLFCSYAFFHRLLYVVFFLQMKINIKKIRKCRNNVDDRGKSAVKFLRNRVKYGNCERAIFRFLADIVILHIYPLSASSVSFVFGLCVEN